MQIPGHKVVLFWEKQNNFPLMRKGTSNLTKAALKLQIHVTASASAASQNIYVEN